MNIRTIQMFTLATLVNVATAALAETYTTIDFRAPLRRIRTG